MWQEVVLCILVEDIERLRGLLPRFKKVIDEPLYGQLTAMQLAFKLGHSRMAEFLIEQGASFKYTLIEGKMPLFFAIARDDIDCFRMLLRQKIDINQRNEDCQTPLMTAIQLGRREMTAALLARNALVDIQDTKGNTALHHNILREDSVTLQLLLTKSPKLDIANYASKPPLVLALEQKDYIAPKYLMQHKEHSTHALTMNRTIKGSDLAAYELYDRFAVELVPNIIASRTPLMVTLLANDLHQAEMLIEQGADLEKVDGQGNTALLICCSLGQTAFVDVLLKLGADPLHRNFNGQTGLMLAGQSGSLPLMERLLDAGVDINAEDKYGDSLFIWALTYQIRPVLQFCFDHRAELRTSDGSGNPSLVVAALKRDFWLIDALLKLQVPVDAQTVLKSTALLTSLQQAADWEIILLLLNWGADVQHRDKFNQKMVDLAPVGRIARLIQAECTLQAYEIESRRLYLRIARTVREQMLSPGNMTLIDQKSLMALVIKDVMSLPEHPARPSSKRLPIELIEACAQRIVIPLMIVSGLMPSPKDYHDPKALAQLRSYFEQKEPHNFGRALDARAKLHKSIVERPPLTATPRLTTIPHTDVETIAIMPTTAAVPIMPLYNKLQDRSASEPGIVMANTWHKPPLHTPIQRKSRISDSSDSQTKA